MESGEERASFLTWLSNVDARFFQERKLGLDLYHSGWLGIATFCLGIAVATVFLLAIFHLIPSRRHVATLLLGMGVTALGLGTLTTWLHFDQLPAAETFPHRALEPLESPLVRADGGALPVTTEQKASVLALPLVAGAVVLALSIGTTLYLSLFWGASWVAAAREERGAAKGAKRRTASR